MREAQAKSPRDPQLTKDLRDLAGNDRFQNLNSDTASEVLKRVGPDAAARTNLTGLATSDGFGKLNAAHQKKALEALDRAPGDAALANDLRGLTSSGDFRNLSDGAKSQVLDGMKTHAADPAARGTISGLAKSPGLGKLADEDKAALLRVTTSDDQTYGPAARAEVDKLIQDPGWSKRSADDQAKALKKVLDDQSFLPHATTAPDGTFSAPGKRVPYTVSAPTDLGGGVKSYQIEVEGKKFPVKISPAPAGTTQYTPDDVGKALASIPKKYRDQIQEVKLEPAVDRENAYMRSSGAGTVYVYPGKPPLAGEDFMASAMLHETGHIVSGRLTATTRTTRAGRPGRTPCKRTGSPPRSTAIPWRARTRPSMAGRPTPMTSRRPCSSTAGSRARRRRPRCGRSSQSDSRCSIRCEPPRAAAPHGDFRRRC
jgi:hypothetical protein